MMQRLWNIALATALTCALGPANSWAADKALQQSLSPELETASGKSLRQVRRVVYDRSRPGWPDHTRSKVARSAAGTWNSIWDEHTGVPLRIFGSGIAAPGAVASAAAAEEFARRYLAIYIDTLAPGAAAKDFVLAGNEELRGVRTVGFYQYHRGMQVVGGQVSFVFKHDRLIVMGSQALPAVQARLGTPVSDQRAAAGATSWIRRDRAPDARAASVGAAVVLPLIGEDGRIEYRSALPVEVGSRAPLSRYTVYVDAATGEPIARQNHLRAIAGTVFYNAAERWPGSDRRDYPAIHASLTVDGEVVTSDEGGLVSWLGKAIALMIAKPAGPFVQIIDEGGALGSAMFDLRDGGSAVWNEANTEFVDAQITTFVHANLAKDYARTLNPALPWLDETMTAHVQAVIPGFGRTCNAVSDGNSIYMFRGDDNCSNTGRLSDVIYHEFGHSLHAQSIIPGAGAFDGALSEGIGDYYAATRNDDPAMGRGIFLSDAPLRHIDPPDREYRWPEDIRSDPHATGLIFAGVMWDLRKELIRTMGKEAGVTYADRLFYAVLQRASDIPSSYVAVLSEDDDDGNLMNGTPNVCLINRTFGLHGLVDFSFGGGVAVSRPSRDGMLVSVETRAPTHVCPDTPRIDSATIEWHLRGQEDQRGMVPMEAGGSVYAGKIPAQEPGSVVRYRVVVAMTDGATQVYPRNPADPYYELYIGDTIPLYCNDFEHDPEQGAQPWTHGALAGDDKWQWGTPTGAGGDPTEAHSGTGVYGMDLGGSGLDGRYASSSHSFARSPRIATAGYDEVRVQYWRWLGVEDGVYDQARVYANDEQVWANRGSDSGATHHRDGEWVFHDIDVSEQAQSGALELELALESDEAVEFGGWTIDDFCVVARASTAAACGDGQLSGNEECDDGTTNSDIEANACRRSCRAAACGDNVIDSGETCDDGNRIDGDGCSSQCVAEAGSGPGLDEAGGCNAAGSSTSGAPLLGGMVLLLSMLIGRRRVR